MINYILPEREGRLNKPLTFNNWILAAVAMSAIVFFANIAPVQGADRICPETLSEVLSSRPAKSQKPATREIDNALAFADANAGRFKYPEDALYAFNPDFSPAEAAWVQSKASDPVKTAESFGFRNIEEFKSAGIVKGTIGDATFGTSNLDRGWFRASFPENGELTMKDVIIKVYVSIPPSTMKRELPHLVKSARGNKACEMKFGAST